ncbi:hypothetical protein HMSSN139_06790 [Paenibacillus sp. HMSSN-139]|nr:hypothetical protein HMSSN139_06790 [Paenibacillus sp. HMSSN-139]
MITLQLLVMNLERRLRVLFLPHFYAAISQSPSHEFRLKNRSASPKLKDASPESVERTAAVLRGLEGKVEQLRGLEVGIDVVRSQRSYYIALIATFDSLEDLEGYQVHPEHKKIDRTYDPGPGKPGGRRF